MLILKIIFSIVKNQHNSIHPFRLLTDWVPFKK